MTLRLAVLFLLAGMTYAGECQMANVVWIQAVTASNLDNPDGLIKKTQSFGCIVINKSTVSVIQSLMEGDATHVLVIPKAMITDVIYLKEDVPDDNRPRPIPNAAPQGDAKNERNLV